MRNLMRIPKVRVRIAVFGLLVGGIAGLAFLGVTSPPCISAVTTCPVGTTDAISGNLGIQSDTPYTATLSGANATADRTVTLPDATSTLITASSTDTLTNKTIDFSLNTGSNYDAGNLIGTILNPTVTSSSLTLLGILNDFSIGSDLTTLTESATYGAGDVEIEGNVIYRDDGVTIPIGDGGTGVETLTANGMVVNGASAWSAVSLGSKGQLFVGDGSGLPQALPVGADGDQLSADPAEVTGLKWIGASGGGSTALQSWAYTNNYQPYTPSSGSWQDWYADQSSNGWNFLGSGDGMDIKGTAMNPPAQYWADWKFMETGQWMVRGRVKYNVNYSMAGGYIGMLGLDIRYTSNSGASFDQSTYNIKELYCSNYCYVTRDVFFIVDVDDIATDYIKFGLHTYGSGPYPMVGNVGYWSCRLDFVRLGS